MNKYIFYLSYKGKGLACRLTLNQIKKQIFFLELD
jgi:hypothetical protein